MSEAMHVIRRVLGEIDFDPQALKARYLAERDRRLREDANDQYVEVKRRLLQLYRRSLHTAHRARTCE